jgi:tRNA modification GTPase
LTTPAPDTIAAIATPAGRGGVGIVRISGGDLSSFIKGLCGRETLPPRRAVYLSFLDDQHRAMDEGIALYFAAPRSYTGENILELHGHGGVAVTRALLARAIQLGARLARPGELTYRAFLNGKLDLAQAEAVADLIDASTTTAMRAAARSLSGVFSKEVNAIADNMMTARVHIEALLDFPEEELDGVIDESTLQLITTLRQNCDALYRRAQAGAPLREGLTVVLVGKTNVGKSSLLNALAREDAAIVTPVAGTTRDTIERQIAIAGIPLTIVDTAGIRHTEDEVEKIGIDRTWAAIQHADIIFLIQDARDSVNKDSASLTNIDDEVAAKLPHDLPRLTVWNKYDLLDETQKAKVRHRSPLAPDNPERDVWISAKTHEGIDDLERAVLDKIHIAPMTEDTFLARERHTEALKIALDELTLAEAEIAQAHPALELIAERLRYAHNALQTITGKVVADDILGEIFSRFCIGK